MVRKSNTIDDFWKKIKCSRKNDCWPWLAGCDSDGYGIFSMDGISYRAARLAFKLVKGKPRGIICHTCNNRKCCNPNHLYDGTAKSNSDDQLKYNTRLEGEKHPRAKLTAALVRRIRKAVEKDNKHGRITKISKKFGISRYNVYGALRGWKSV